MGGHRAILREPDRRSGSRPAPSGRRRARAALPTLDPVAAISARSAGRDVDERSPWAGPGPAELGPRSASRAPSLGQPVARLDRHERLELAAGRDERGQTGARPPARDRPCRAAASPTGTRTVTRSRPADELGRRGLDRRDDEQGVRSAAAGLGPSRSPRRLGHRRGAGVDADDQRVRAARAAAATTARPSPVPTSIWTRSVAGDEVGQLADVHLEEASTDRVFAWSGEDTLEPCPRRRSAPTRACRSRSAHPTQARSSSPGAWPASSRPGAPDLVVEHLGSSAVPGLPGKGVVDLGIHPSDPSRVPAITEILLDLGFQRQDNANAFPATRPLVLGGLAPGDGDEQPRQIHLHVIPDDAEWSRQIAFRDALRADPRLVDEYAALKREIVDAGITSGLRYSMAKTAFIRRVLAEHGAAEAPIPIGSTIGILGGGQLGRMLGCGRPSARLSRGGARSGSGLPGARRSPIDRSSPPTTTRRAALELADGCAVVTYELEHVSALLADAVEERLPLRPGAFALKTTQHRLAERRFLESIYRADGALARGSLDRRPARRRGGARLPAPPQGGDRWLRRTEPGPDRRAATGRRGSTRPGAPWERSPSGPACCSSPSSSSRWSSRSSWAATWPAAPFRSPPPTTGTIAGILSRRSPRRRHPCPARSPTTRPSWRPGSRWSSTSSGR